MKHFNATNALWTGAIALSVATSLSLPAIAQTNISPDGTSSTTTEVETDRDDGFDWGWLGLLGLLGLAGLARKSDDRVHYRDPNASSTIPTSRSDYNR